ncbi:MAG: DUF3179 domain-containing protein [Chloroflexi bacterium]|nr:DUF3179 domain-containing protein [Chloroflexota bacterium]
MMADIPSGTVTFLFTDIQGSTKSWERNPQAMTAVLARHDAIMRTAIAAHNGHIFKTVGDAFCVAFATAPAAIAAAIRSQHGLHNEKWDPAIGTVKVRMAVHTGAPELRDSDYFGTPLNRVARLLAIGHGGQILLSLATAELVRDVLPPEVGLRDLGLHRLKDVRFPERVMQIDVPVLPRDFPPLLTVAGQMDDLPEREVVLGVVVAGQARAYPIEMIRRLGVLNDELGGSPIAIVVDPRTGHPTVFRRQSAGRSVTLVADESDSRYLTNTERTVWWDRTGKPVSSLRGALATPLERLDVVTEWWSSWKGRFPNTTVHVE